tara:strand:+ start:8197 stop:9606 length:1410 start_codon:yes stop_codon:yes gene_type:complete
MMSNFSLPKYVAQRWASPAGYREVLQLALPMILSTGAWGFLLFFDRMFLAWYSAEAVAAAMPAGMTSFALLAFFMGISAFVNTFVAQYFGAADYTEIGAIVWQGLYVSLFSLVFIVPVYFLAEALFAAAGHAPEVQELEVIYFKTLLFSAVFQVMNNALSSFFSGMGKTLVLMWVSLLILVVNLVLDYVLIFGYWGFPEMGIRGAAIATNIGIITGFFTFVFLITSKLNQNKFHTLKRWRFDSVLFLRLLRFGLPNGVRLFIDMSAFAAFLLLVGLLGTLELVASNIAFNINALSFLPMVGMMVAVSVLVGQRLGRGEPELAERSVWSAIHISFVFFTVLGASYVLVPEFFIWPFTQHGGLDDLAGSHELVVILLRFIAFFGLFDAMFLVLLGALEGAGDTRFIMRSSFAVSFLLLILPCYFYVQSGAATVTMLWLIATLNIIVYCALYYWRFRKAGWKKMRVIADSAD